MGELAFGVALAQHTGKCITHRLLLFIHGLNLATRFIHWRGQVVIGGRYTLLKMRFPTLRQTGSFSYWRPLIVLCDYPDHQRLQTVVMTAMAVSKMPVGLTTIHGA